MTRLRVRPLDVGEIDDAEEVLGHLTNGDEARLRLARLGGVDPKSLEFGDGWAAAVELDGVSVLVRGEPQGAGLGWTILAKAGTSDREHAARRLRLLVEDESSGWAKSPT